MSTSPTPRLQHRRGRPAAQVPQLAAFPPHGGGVLRPVKGRWRFFWGRWGNAGEVVLEEGDIFNIPTGIFRGFENIGTDYGMIMAILGGDDAGGGVIWAPQVIEDAQAHGLVLSERASSTTPRRASTCPRAWPDAPPDRGGTAAFPEPTAADVVPGYVARYWDLVALADRTRPRSSARPGVLRDKPGFEVDLVTRASATRTPHSHDRPSVLMPVRGHWRVTWPGGETVLAPGDTMSVPDNLDHSAVPAMTGRGRALSRRGHRRPAGSTWKPAA
jgi:mannose-6-phosphate isomerase-like protein (cupin superfamily)